MIKTATLYVKASLKNEDAMIAVAAELRKNGYDVSCYDIIPMI